MLRWIYCVMLSPNFSAFIPKTRQNILKVKHASCYLGFNFYGLFYSKFFYSSGKSIVYIKWPSTLSSWTLEMHKAKAARGRQSSQGRGRQWFWGCLPQLMCVCFPVLTSLCNRRLSSVLCPCLYLMSQQEDKVPLAFTWKVILKLFSSNLRDFSHRKIKF